MTVVQLKDHVFGMGAGSDASFILELDEENWNEIQKDIKSRSDGNFMYANGKYASQEEIEGLVFDKLRIPYVGEFDIIKSDKFKLTPKEND